MNVKLKILLTYILSCSVVPGFGIGDSPAKLYSGTLRPLDPDVCTSQNITFTCTLLSSSVPGNSIGFAVKNESTDKMFLPVSEGRVSVINETSSEFTIYNINATMCVYVRCYYWEIFGDQDVSGQLGVDSTASIYSLPKKVKQINCIVENYTQSMKCSWNYGTIYKPSAFPEVIFHWRVPSLSASWSNCPDLNKESGYCYWNSSDSGDFIMKNIDIKLTLKERCGVNVSSDFMVDAKKIVKPHPVVDLGSSVLNSTCIRVQWRTNNSKMSYPKEHRVNVSSKWNDPWVSTFNTTENTEKDTHGMTFCDLHPYTVYTFVVSIQPTGDQAGFYSDPRETVATTYSEIPSVSPEVTKGGYSWNHRDCEGHNAGRRVCLFWKPIHEEDKNGPMKGLEGSFRPVTPSKIQFDENWAEDSTYGCSSGLLCNTSYVFSINARNVNGTSKTGSTMVIYAATPDISLPQLIIEVADGSDVSVSWTSTGKANGFLVVWCRNKNGDCENRNMVNWQFFSPDKREAVIQINSANSPQDFLYGVSVLTDQGSSGLEWEDCVYLKNAYPKMEPQNVIVTAGPEDNTLVVTWDKLMCQSDGPYIDMYNVRYNKLNEKVQKSLNVTASGEARVVLEDLDENQSYIVTVRGITKDGRYGPESQPQTGMPENRSLKPEAIAGITTGVLFVVIFAACGCVYIFRRCKKQAEVVVKDNEVFIPEDNILRKGGMENTGMERSSFKSIERQNSDDSGYTPMTPPTERFVNQQPKLVYTPKPQGRPVDHVYVTREDDHISDNFDTPAVELSRINVTNTIQPQPAIARVRFVMGKNNRTNDERFVKRINREADENETAVKARVKNVSGDSGVSDAYSKETLGGTEKNKNTENYVDVDEKIVDTEFLSNIEAPDHVLGNKVINSSFSDTNSKTGFQYGNSTLQNISGARSIIPKPSAFSDYSERDNSLSDQEDIFTGPVNDTSAGTSTYYVKAQSNADLVNGQFSEYVRAQRDFTGSAYKKSDNYQGHLHDREIQNEDNKTEPDKVLKSIYCPALTSIPRPRDMDESDSSSTEEENVSFPSHPDAFPKVPLSNMHISGNMVFENSNKPTTTHLSISCNSQSENTNRQPPDYVTATDTSDTSVHNSLLVTPQQLANSDTGYFTMSNVETYVSGTQETPTPIVPHQFSDHAHVSQSECLPSKQNQDASGSYYTSVTNPNVTHRTHLPQMSSPVVSKVQYSVLSNQCSVKLLSNIKIPIPSAFQTDLLPSDHIHDLSTAVTGNCTSEGNLSQPSNVQSPAGSSPIPISSDGYISPSSAVEGQLSPVIDVQSLIHSPCLQNFGDVVECVTPTKTVPDKIQPDVVPGNMSFAVSENCFSHPKLSQNIAPKSSTSDHLPSDNMVLPHLSGYVLGTDRNSLLTSSAGRDVQPEYVLSMMDETHHQCSESTSSSGSGNTDQSLHGATDFDLTVPCDFKEESFHVTQSNVNEPIQRSMSESHAPQGPNVFHTNGYVCWPFLSDDDPHAEEKDPLAVEMRNAEEQENMDARGSKRDSDSGLSSLGHESTETEREQPDPSSGCVYSSPEQNMFWVS